MKLPVEWLKAHVDVDLAVDALAERLAMTGTEVERVTRHGVAALEHFVVAKVVTSEPHPDADRLTVCQVDIGDGGEPRQIVCGAPNVAAGQTVAVARPGSVMPDGTKLKSAKLRGETSEGMILAEDELGIGMDHAGIMVLADELAAGTPLEQVLPLTTEVLELEITPNRPDCLSVLGVAREVHAITGAEMRPPAMEALDGEPDSIEGFSVDVQAPELCPRFTAVLYEDVQLGPSPAWLKARLMAAGQRPINNVVDITNYVMLLTGQPMHAFDADLVAGGTLTVRRARDGETITTLDDVARTLDSDIVVIEDADGPTSIAGIMGGQRSEVRDSTTRVLMEAATWNGPNLQRSSVRLQLRTEASGRFEKQLQPEFGSVAQNVTAVLMRELCGARRAPGVIDVFPAPPGDRQLRVRDAKTNGLLGVEVARERAVQTLERLGFEVTEDADGLEVTVPFWRRDDVTREADVIEEIARLVALEALPATLPSRRGASGLLSFEQRMRRRAEDALIGAGVSEAVGWSFESTAIADKLRLPAEDPRRQAVALANPMSEEQAVMRTTLLSSLLGALQHNRTRGADTIRLFEGGQVYTSRGLLYKSQPEEIFPFTAVPPGDTTWADRARDAELPHQPLHLATLLTGPGLPPTWRDARPAGADYFAAKGVLESMLRALRVHAEFAAAPEPFLHPGRAARVRIGGEDVGWLGEIHPQVAAEWDIEEPVAGFEIDLDCVIAAAPRELPYADMTSFPAVRQDLAVVVAAGVTAAEVIAVVRDAGGALLRSAEIFDVYRGEQVGEGRTSLALRLEFRTGERTLTDEDVAPRRAKIVKALTDKLGAELRG